MFARSLMMIAGLAGTMLFTSEAEAGLFGRLRCHKRVTCYQRSYSYCCDARGMVQSSQITSSPVIVSAENIIVEGPAVSGPVNAILQNHEQRLQTLEGRKSLAVTDTQGNRSLRRIRINR